MDFKKCSINGQKYGKGLTEIGKAAMLGQGKEIPAEDLDAEERASRCNLDHVSFYDPRIFSDLSNKTDPQRQKIIDFMRVLAVCHTVIPEQVAYVAYTNLQ